MKFKIYKLLTVLFTAVIILTAVISKQIPGNMVSELEDTCQSENFTTDYELCPMCDDEYETLDD